MTCCLLHCCCARCVSEASIRRWPSTHDFLVHPALCCYAVMIILHRFSVSVFTTKNKKNWNKIPVFRFFNNSFIGLNLLFNPCCECGWSLEQLFSGLDYTIKFFSQDKKLKSKCKIKLRYKVDKTVS